MSRYFARRKRIEQFRFVAIGLCIIGALIWMFAACAPPKAVSHTTVFVHPDTVKLPAVILTDTTHNAVTIYDTTHSPVRLYDTTRVPVVLYDTSRHSVSVFDTSHVPVVMYDTAHVAVTKYDTTRANIALVDTLKRTDTLHFVFRDTIKAPTVILPADSIKPPVVQLPPDTVKGKMILWQDTVFLRVGDPPISFQYGDSIKIPVKVLPRCSCSTPIDTIEHFITQGSSIQAAGVDTIGMHIYDWPTRSGELDVYLGTKFLGRLLQGNNPNEWFVYRSVPGSIVMPKDSTSYPSKLEAMKALLPSS